MIDAFLQQLDGLLLLLFGLFALTGAVAMLLLRHPMRVAMSLVFTMISLGGIYGLLGVHFLAAFQVLIYVSAVMVFIVYVIMLLDVRDLSFTQRFSRIVVPTVFAAGCSSSCWRWRSIATSGCSRRPRRRTASASSRSTSCRSTGCNSR